MKYFSMFAGIGGFELGIYRVCVKDTRQSTLPPFRTTQGQFNKQLNKSTEGLPCVGYSELDKYAIQIYQKHFKGHKNYGDAQRIKWKDVPDFDLLVGGFPCQSFSIAGKRGGLKDTRGTLFFEIARCLREKQPRLFLIENVRGLLSHDKGNTFATILTTLDECGYDCEWQVLNSKNFGVPQNRERVFIVGHLRGSSRPEVFPIGQGGGTGLSESGQGEFRQHKYKEVSTAVTSRQFKGGGQLVSPIRTDEPNPRSKGNQSDSSNSIRRASYTDDMRIRRLTPTECERLQGFPDGWTEGVSDTQRYKCLGNAVTVNVIEAIIAKMGVVPIQ